MDEFLSIPEEMVKLRQRIAVLPRGDERSRLLVRYRRLVVRLRSTQNELFVMSGHNLQKLDRMVSEAIGWKETDMDMDDMLHNIYQRTNGQFRVLLWYMEGFTGSGYLAALDEDGHQILNSVSASYFQGSREALDDLYKRLPEIIERYNSNDKTGGRKA